MALDLGTYPTAQLVDTKESGIVSAGLESAFNSKTLFLRGEGPLVRSVGLRGQLDPMTLHMVSTGPLILPGLPRIIPPVVPPPTYETYGYPALPPRTIRQASAYVSGVDTTHIIDATVDCVMNGVNTATLTVPASGAMGTNFQGADAGVTVGGLSVLGRVVEFLKYEVAVGDEVNQVCTFNIESYLADWDQVIVYPDVGGELAKDMRKPMVQDRTFDFHSSSGFVETGLTNSFAIDANYGVSGQERFPLPDFWPDPTGKWMWGGPGGDDYVGIGGKGTVYFRTKTKKSRTTSSQVQVWCCMYDSGEVRIDGKLVLECTNAGEAVRAYVTMSDERSHLVTIRAHNGGGRAGVLFALMPVINDPKTGQRFGDAIIQSGTYWKCKAYSGNAPYSPKRILNALINEATMRGASGMTVSVVNNAPDSPCEITMPVGITMLEALDQLAESWVDYWVTGNTLYIYPKGGGYGSAVTGTYLTEHTVGGQL